MESKKPAPKAGFTRNPSLKRKPPVVKQTKGSLLRMIKANPLIAVDEKTKQELGITDAELRQLGHIGVVQRTMSLNPSYAAELKSNGGNNISKNRCIPKVANKATNRKLSHFNGDKKVSNLPKNPNKPPESVQAKPSVNFNISKSSLAHKQKQPSRRSVSAEKFDEKKHFLSYKTPRTYSMENIREAERENVNVTPLSKTKAFNFKTPQTYRNVFSIPSTLRKVDRKGFSCSTPADVKVKLNTWLSKRGKSLGSCHHLKCFGILQDEIEEEKENIERPGPVRSDSYESLGIISEGHELKGDAATATPSTKPIIDYDGIAKDALNDLLRLIQDRYPADRCGVWLNMIREKCQNIEDEPTYWECRAALEECNENIPNAIICYRTAIIKGAEVKNVDGSLDLLLEKFSLLNIDSNVNEKDNKKKNKIIMDARNVFKLTIIQFAVHERENRKKENINDSKKQLLITPVRRSSRLSLNHKLTPGVKLCSSLKEFGEPKDFDFKKNNFLSVRYN